MLLPSSIDHKASYEKYVDLIISWQYFLEQHSWQTLIEGVVPKVVECGIIYELPNYLNRSNEGFAIADMRNIKISQPHYHGAPEVEIYFILQGTAIIVIGTHEHAVRAGDVIVIEPNKAHFTVPDENLIMAIVNTPPFNPANYITLENTDESVGFYREQFEKFARKS